MTQEEKAKAYDRAIERARVWKDKSGMPKNKQGILDDIFPELEESEDEKIKKSLISYLHGLGEFDYPDKKTYHDWLEWLEKQGEQKVNYTTLVETGNGGINALVTRELPTDGCDDEQKPAEKIEPKFQHGQWIVWQNKCYKVNYNGCGYELVDQNGLRTSLEYGTVDKSAHLWTIADAKDGDVLAEDTCTFIIKKLNHDFTAEIYCCLYDDGDFELNSNLGFDDTCTYPATKEQRDLLFQKKHEAGYEWDADKKKLKLLITNGGDFFETENCEQKPAWSEKDTFKVQRICKYLNEAKYYTDITEVRECMEWLKSLKQRIEK